MQKTHRVYSKSIGAKIENPSRQSNERVNQDVPCETDNQGPDSSQMDRYQSSENSERSVTICVLLGSEISSMYPSEYTSGFFEPAASHLAAPPSPRHDGNVGQALTSAHLLSLIRSSNSLARRARLRILILSNQTFLRKKRPCRSEASRNQEASSSTRVWWNTLDRTLRRRER